MKKPNYHGLKFQVLLVLKLFVACIVAAIGLVSYRDWVEGFMKERPVPVPSSLQTAINAIEVQKPIQKLYEEIPPQDRVILYDVWMGTEPIQRTLPQELCTLDPQLFIGRAERTLVCGSKDQRMRALQFIELGNHRDAIPVLVKASAWARRRTFVDFADEIDATLKRLQQLQETQDG